MDKPTLDALYELTGEGTQTIVNNGSGVVTGNFYKIYFAKTANIISITIDGQSGTGLDGIGATRHLVLTNVTSIAVSSGVVICYTAPTVPGIES
tara:strand:+ start:1124 stop:1405 length:282 start_codon:yes stop_codon:yes gene_type:complete